MAHVECSTSACLLREAETSKRFLLLVTLERYNYKHNIALPSYLFALLGETSAFYKVEKQIWHLLAG